MRSAAYTQILRLSALLLRRLPRISACDQEVSFCHFITPYDIENSLAFATADLFRGIPGVSVIGAGGGGILSYQGDIVQMLSATGYCTPTIYLDGLRLSPSVTSTNSLEGLVPLNAIDAAEIYRRPSEVPIEYAGTGVQSSTGDFGVCGVLVLWTKRR